VTDRAHVLEALGTVHDPELDEPITSLRFVTSCDVSADGDVDVRLRLPTPQCAPNFAFLMAADARDAVRRLPEVREVTVVLEGHYTGREINGAVGRGEGFSGAFPGETEGELDALRELFHRKALVARQSGIGEALLAAGATTEEVTALRVADLPDDANAHRCLELREHLGIPADAGAPAFVLPDGTPIAAADLKHWLRMARLVRTSLEANGGICRSLLAARYDIPDTDPEEVAA
jgi:metal-sulfur cluster biosynthetic enzyme